MRRGYPVTLDVEGKVCAVFGAGSEARKKVEGLRAAGAEVRWIEREYRPGDLEGCFLAISAGPDRGRNAEIFDEAEREGVLMNAVDDPDHCRFLLPAIHRQGDLSIAISTTGKCPALAARLRQRFEAEFGPEYAEFLSQAGEVRGRLARAMPNFDRRRRFWYRLVDEFLLAAENKKEMPCPTS